MDRTSTRTTPATPRSRRRSHGCSRNRKGADQMKLVQISFAASVVAAVALVGASSAAAVAPGLCVGATQGCLATVQAAVDAAQDGDTIRIEPGTFQGGITIPKSVRLVGAGA